MSPHVQGGAMAVPLGVTAGLALVFGIWWLLAICGVIYAGVVMAFLLMRRAGW